MSLPRALIERFVRRLADTYIEVVALETEFAAVLDPPASLMEQLRSIAHKLAGTAQPYGFPALGVSARALEHVILGGAPGWGALSAEIGRMREALDHAVRGEPDVSPLPRILEQAEG